MDANEKISTNRGGLRAAVERDRHLAAAEAETVQMDVEQPSQPEAGNAPTRVMKLTPMVPVVDRVDEISIDGKQIGTVRTQGDAYLRNRCHAVIDLQRLGFHMESWHDTALAQGHGDTPDAAIANAIDRGRQFAEEYAAAIQKLKASVGG